MDPQTQVLRKMESKESWKEKVREKGYLKINIDLESFRV